ncbi:MAG: site-specific integrase [Acidobacteriota bacterium]|nr:site-specific integrase [Acidobacteriota bacterium]
MKSTPISTPAVTRYNRQELAIKLNTAIETMRFRLAKYSLAYDKRKAVSACEQFVKTLDGCSGRTLQERWTTFESTVWKKWTAGENRPSPANYWAWGPRVIVITRLVIPSWEWTKDVYLMNWVLRLPETDSLFQQYHRLVQALETVSWAKGHGRHKAARTGLRLMLTRGYDEFTEITDTDLQRIPSPEKGIDVLDAALCSLGVFDRTPQRGSSRKNRRGQKSIRELVEIANIPARFWEVTTLYLETYQTRISDVYVTRRHKVIALAHFWSFLAQHYPEVRSSADVSPAQARAYIPSAIERARKVRRGRAADDATRITAHSRLVDVRTFFSDICTWATEPDSPFATFAPRTVPLTRHDLVNVGFEKARKQQTARTTATVLDLEREMPNLRSHASRAWRESQAALKNAPLDSSAKAAEAAAFWDWALLELLLQSGLRIEEASELTSLDILKRRLPDGSLYYMLHVKPSKFDRARVIPIGDGLGRVLAEILQHVKSFYGTTEMPFCNHWDHNERQPWPAGPYLLQGAKHPSPIGIQTIRGRLKAISVASGVKRSDGTPLVVLPHDCRRAFASEHLNNNTPVHVIQALLGHATIDTVMIYAKLYPRNLVEEYRKTVRGLYNSFHGADSLKNPTAEEWTAFERSCSMRDMGTHLCALPTGEHCPRGLVCLGCVHAQPKKSAAPVFRRMLVSHERALATAKLSGEPVGQLAARELEVARIRGALQRAEELSADVAAAIESAAGLVSISPARRS